MWGTASDPREPRAIAQLHGCTCQRNEDRHQNLMICYRQRLVMDGRGETLSQREPSKSLLTSTLTLLFSFAFNSVSSSVPSISLFSQGLSSNFVTRSKRLFLSMSFFKVLANKPVLALTANATTATAFVRSQRALLPTIIRHSSSATAAPSPSGADHDHDELSSRSSQQIKRRQVHPLRSRGYLDPSQPSAEEAVSHILYNIPDDIRLQQERYQRHVLNCLVQNEPGVLSRVSGILAGRGFNIDSLVVAKTEVTDLSRMTIVLRGEDDTVEQARRQLEDLTPVWAVLDYTGFKIIQRELLLAKVSILGPEHVHMQRVASSSASNPIQQQQQQQHHLHHHQQEPIMSPSKILLQTQAHLGSLTELSRLFQGRVVDVSEDSVVLELSAKPDRIDAFIKLIQPFGILEAARSGMMAMPRSLIYDLHGGLQDDDQAQEEGSGVDAALLPPG